MQQHADTLIITAGQVQVKAYGPWQAAVHYPLPLRYPGPESSF